MLRLGVWDGPSSSKPVLAGKLAELGALGRGVTFNIESEGIVLAPLSSCSLRELADVHIGIALCGPDIPEFPPDVELQRDGIEGALSRNAEEVWLNRIVPFERNLRLNKRARRLQTPVLVSSDSAWADQAKRLLARIGRAAGGKCIRIDHIGSTSVSGLPAKNIIDIQVVVANREDGDAVADRCRRAGFVRAEGEWFGLDRNGNKHHESIVVDADTGRPVNVNIRSVDSPTWRDALLFRDWLRGSERGRADYLALKRKLSQAPESHVDSYGDSKMPFIWQSLEEAEEWVRIAAWVPDRNSGSEANGRNSHGSG